MAFQSASKDLLLVDVHAHLDHDKFKPDFDIMLAQAKAAGVKAIITNGVNPASNEGLIALSKKDPIIKVAMGLYPLDALGLGADAAGLPTQTGPVDMDAALSYIESRKDDIVAIGEVGLDFKMDDKFHAAQKVNFERIIALSEKIKKPMIIHSRGAESDIVAMLESSKVKKAVLHCFSGNKKLIQKAADLGLSFSIPANIVKMQHFQLLVSMVNSSQLLTETDAPWLGPVSGVRNVPQNVRLAVEKIAEIKGLDIGEASMLIFKNYQVLFLR
ncbi:MAG: TatD family hydrolase [Nanoarchaeota archaeon]